MQGPVRAQIARLDATSHDELWVWYHVHEFHSDPFARATKIRRRVEARAFQVGASVGTMAKALRQEEAS